MAEATEDQTNAEAAIAVRAQQERVKKLARTRRILESNEEGQSKKPAGKEPVPPITRPFFRQQPISVAGENLRKITGEASPQPPKPPEKRTPEEIIRAAYDRPAKPGPSMTPSSEGTGVSPITQAARERKLPPKATS
jgi:hypothetical protein